jgi:hypothetical protein
MHATREKGRALHFALILVAALASGCAESGSGISASEIFRSAGLGGVAPLDESTVAAGLKESLRIGTERTVAATSQQDGFWGNPLLRIALPDSLAPMASALRKVGLGSKVDELELAMNRAAETASAEARQVFWTAIKQMTFKTPLES